MALPLPALPDLGSTRLHLGHRGYTGSLPAVWSRLTALTGLDLSSNFLSGTLPPQWSCLTRLKVTGRAGAGRGTP